MDDAVQLKPKLRSRMKKALRSLQSVATLMENDDVESAALIASRLIKTLDQILESLKNHSDYSKSYMELTLVNKMPRFAETKISLESMNKVIESGETVSRPAVEKLISELTEYAYRIDHEIDVVLPSKLSWRNYVRDLLSKHKTKIILGGAFSLILFIALFFLIHMQKTKHSLVGEYYRGTNFETLYKKRFDTKIKFRWGYGSPFFSFDVDQFSIRWTGYLMVPKKGNYEFSILTDDGTVLWVDDKKVISNWTAHPAQMERGTVYLEEGTHPIKLEYFDDHASAEITLFWKHETDPSPKIIEQKFFISSNKYLQ